MLQQQRQQQIRYRWPRNTYRPQHGGLTNANQTRRYRRHFYNDTQALSKAEEKTTGFLESLMGWLQMLIDYLCCLCPTDVPIGAILTAKVAAWMLVPLHVVSWINTALLAGLFIEVPLVALYVVHKTECPQVIDTCSTTTTSTIAAIVGK